MKRFAVVLLIPCLFLLAALFTLKDYWVSWDESEHLLRGQAYLYYFLTGNKRYPVGEEKASYFQNDSLPPEHWLVADTGHPPLNGILAALSNYIFHQKLRILGDIESHHLFNIVTSVILVFAVSVFAYLAHGKFVALVSGAVLSLYPLFFSEAHFNIKDPPQAAFYALTILFFWLSLRKKNHWWLLAAAVSFAISLSIKFNIIFLPLIIIPYLFFRFYPKFNFRKIPKSFIWVLVFSPLIVGIIFFGSWPFLWQDPIVNFIKTINYYIGVGTGFETQPGYFIAGFNLYPIFWILITTQSIVLVLAFFGIVFVARDKEKERTSLLWLFWFLTPIVRVTVPGISIYGGVRQIMEFIPAMALLAGLGASYLIQKLKLTIYKYLFILITFILLLIPIVKYHPHENVYFNFLVGGLKGAKEKNIPYWGNSYGNAYKEAFDWLKENARPNSKVALVEGTSLNIPRIAIGLNLDYSNDHWSGDKKKGEYLVELTYNNPVRYYPEAWDYVEKFLVPVYEVKVDGVAIAKVWKNDLEHTK